MRARDRMSTRVSAIALGAIAVGATLGSVAEPATPAHAADQIVFELVPSGEGICSFSGSLGQTFTPDQSGTPEEFSVWTQATDGGVPVGGTASATVSIGWWIAEGFAPFSTTENVVLPATEEPTQTTISPEVPGSFIAGVQYAIIIDFDSVDTCPVALTASADPYDGGSMVLDQDSVQGNLALRVQYRGDETQPDPDPETPAVIEGTPPAAVQGTPYSYQFDLEGNPPPTASVTQGSLPPGLSLSEDALLSGTPTETGTFQARLVAENGVGPAAIIDVQIVVHPREAAQPPAPAAPAKAAPPARPASSSSAQQTLAKTGPASGPALPFALAMLVAGAALAGTALHGRGRPAAALRRGR